MLETTTSHKKHAGEFFKPPDQDEFDFNSLEFEKEFEDNSDKISIKKLEKVNSCHRNVVYYKLKANKSEIKATWNWTIQNNDESFSSQSDNNSINFR
jgi:hypothetical protein